LDLGQDSEADPAIFDDFQAYLAPKGFAEFGENSE
jgi:hypothetical protein